MNSVHEPWYRSGPANLRDALAFPQFSIQVLVRDPTDWVYAVETLTRQVYLSTGWIGIALVTIYAILTGVALTNTVTLLRHARGTGVSTVAGIVPGVLAAGCASCGAGVLANAGDPRTCAVPLPSDPSMW